eukprot:jgi/Tetstr1/458876/TSEL_004384.t1
MHTALKNLWASVAIDAGAVLDRDRSGAGDLTLETSGLRPADRSRPSDLTLAGWGGAACDYMIDFACVSSTTPTWSNDPRWCIPGIAATEAEHAKLAADRASSAPVQGVHRYYPFVVEDRGRLGKSALTVVYIFAVLLAVRNFPGDWFEELDDIVDVDNDAGIAGSAGGTGTRSDAQNGVASTSALQAQPASPAAAAQFAAPGHSRPSKRSRVSTPAPAPGDEATGASPSTDTDAIRAGPAAAQWALPSELVLSAEEIRSLWPSEANESGTVIPRAWLVGQLVDALRLHGRVILLGEAGIGKSAVMKAFCSPSDSGSGRHVVASYCFRFNRNDVLDQRVFLCSVASQLAESFPAYRKQLEASSRLQELLSAEQLSRPKAPLKALREAVLKPLGRIKPGTDLAAYIVVDALDEAAEGGAYRTLGLVEAIHTHLESGELPWLKLLCSARPDDPSRPKHIAARLIRGAVDSLMRRAGLNFQWLAFVVRQIEQDAGGLNFNSDEVKAPAGLGHIYKQNIKESLPLQVFRPLRPLVKVLLYSRVPLSTEQLFGACRFAGLSLQDVEAGLQRLNGYVRCRAGLWELCHRTVSEWLADSGEAGDYYCEPLDGRSMLLAQLCCAHGVISAASDVQRLSAMLKLFLPLEAHTVKRATGRLAQDNVLGHMIGLCASLEAGHVGKERDWRWLLGKVVATVRSEALAQLGSDFQKEDIKHGQMRGARDWRAVANALQPRPREHNQPWVSNTALEGVHLSYWDDPAAVLPGAKQVAEALTPRPNPDGTWALLSGLTELNLFKCSIGDDGAAALSGALGPRRATEHGNWTAAEANPDGSYTFNTTLSDLQLANNHIGAEGAAALAEAMKAWKDCRDGSWRHCALETLILKYNSVADAGAAALARGLRPSRTTPAESWFTNKTLRHLSLKRNGIGDAGAEDIASILRADEPNPDGSLCYNSVLSKLDLAANCIEEEGAAALASAMQARKQFDGSWRHCALEEVILDYNSIGDVGAEALACAFQPTRTSCTEYWFTNKTLRQLSLKGNNIEDAGAVALSEGICPVHNPDYTFASSGLQALYLAENPSLGAYGTLALHQVQRLRRKESCSKIILGIATDEETPPRCVIG